MFAQAVGFLDGVIMDILVLSVCQRPSVEMNSQAATKNVLKHVSGDIPQPVITGFASQPAISTAGKGRKSFQIENCYCPV
jgi:hypothetical protein